jgi:hypothetical protein
MYQTVSIKNKIELVSKQNTKLSFVVNPKTNLRDSVYTTNYYFQDGAEKTDVKTIFLMYKGKDIVTSKEEIKASIIVNNSDKWTLIWMVFIQVLFVTMVYGPIAAFLVELFPTNIRYTSMSLPYHIGNGVFGGLLPAVAVYLATKANDANTLAEATSQQIPYDKPYLEGLWYPIIVSAVCFIIGMVYINSKHKHIDD